MGLKTVIIICTTILSLLLAGSIYMSLRSIMKKQTPGPQGPQGPQGATGPRGASGKQGAAGKPASSRDNDEDQNLQQFIKHFTTVMSALYSDPTDKPGDKSSDTTNISNSDLDAAQDAFRVGLINTFKDTDALTTTLPHALTNSAWQSADNNEAFRKANKNIGVDCDEDSVCKVTNADKLKQYRGGDTDYVDAAGLNIGGNPYGDKSEGSLHVSHAGYADGAKHASKSDESTWTKYGINSGYGTLSVQYGTDGRSAGGKVTFKALDGRGDWCDGHGC